MGVKSKSFGTPFKILDNVRKFPKKLFENLTTTIYVFVCFGPISLGIALENSEEKV